MRSSLTKNVIRILLSAHVVAAIQRSLLRKCRIDRLRTNIISCFRGKINNESAHLRWSSVPQL